MARVIYYFGEARVLYATLKEIYDIYIFLYRKRF
jgi:hypothetical protein